MKNKEVKVSKAEKVEYKNYLRKATEFYETMQDNLIKGKWNAAALNAIHAGISANDALLVYFHGIRSSSPKHDDAVRLLVSLTKHPDAEKNAAHLRKLIAMKNIVEYESRLFTRHEAEALSKHAERFFRWVEGLLPKE